MSRPSFGDSGLPTEVGTGSNVPFSEFADSSCLALFMELDDTIQIPVRSATNCESTHAGYALIQSLTETTRQFEYVFHA